MVVCTVHKVARRGAWRYGMCHDDAREFMVLSSSYGDLCQNYVLDYCTLDRDIGVFYQVRRKKASIAQITKSSWPRKEIGAYVEPGYNT